MDSRSTRKQIFKNLLNAPQKASPKSPTLPPLKELNFTKKEMVENFITEITRQTGQVHQVKNFQAAAKKLTQIANENNFKNLIASTDNAIGQLKISEWGKTNQIQVKTAGEFEDKKLFKNYVFKQADAGITGVDYAIAESGTLCLIHDKNQPRLVSIAVLTHIAIVPTNRLVAVYEQAIENIFKDKDFVPSQVTFITGPSMTADIKARSFRGMHGPKHLIVILIDE